METRGKLSKREAQREKECEVRGKRASNPTGKDV